MSNVSLPGKISTLKELRTLISEPPAMMKKRVQPAVDDHCLAVINNSSVCVVGFADQAGIVCINLRATRVLRAEADCIDLAWPTDEALPGALERGLKLNCSLYFIMPGIGFTLRANGLCSSNAGDGARVVLNFRAEELFLHCSRAKVRANFWEPRIDRTACAGTAGRSVLSEQALAVISRSPYALLLTQDSAGKTDLSPRGDPEGFVLALDSGTLLIPERPGNKVACTLTNILSHEGLTVAFLTPGSAEVLVIIGRSWLSAAPCLLERAAIQGKVPKIGIVVHVDQYYLGQSRALVEAGLWSKETHLSERDIPSFSRMLAEHMNGRGLFGKATTMLVGAVVKHDLKHLY